MTGDGDLRLGFNTRVGDDYRPHANLWGLANGLEFGGIKPVDLGEIALCSHDELTAGLQVLDL